MPYLADPAALLRDSEVTRFFLTVLESAASADEKYGRFIQFFESHSRIGRELLGQTAVATAVGLEDPGRVLAAAAERAGVWQPREILRAVEESLERAVGRLHSSCHRDGGWGYEVEVSSVWGTAWAVWLLDAARKEGLGGRKSRDLGRSGFRWLLDRREEWSIEDVPPHGGASIYDATLVMRCAYQTGRAHLPEVAPWLDRSLGVLERVQNVDGGWDAKVWGPEPLGEVGRWSDLGATSAVLRTMALSGRDDLRAPVRRGAEALVSHQCLEGGWRPRFSGPEGVNANKTCDGLKGLLAAGRMGVDLDEEPYRGAIRRAVVWLREQERPVIDPERGVRGWGWSASDLSAVENTCLILETLVEIPSIPLPLLTSNALWLTEVQVRSPGNPEDGDWPNKDTARIALSLVRFFRKIRESSLFQPASDEPE